MPLLIALVILIGSLFAVAWIPLVQGRDAWLRGHDAEAIAIGEKWSRLHLWPAQYHQLLAAAYLTSGNAAGARPHLDAIGSMRLSVIPKDELARRLFARERYDEFLAYDAASRDARENANVPLYRAAALVATNRLAEGQKAFASIDRARSMRRATRRCRRHRRARQWKRAVRLRPQRQPIGSIRANEVVADDDAVRRVAQPRSRRADHRRESAAPRSQRHDRDDARSRRAESRGRRPSADFAARSWPSIRARTRSWPSPALAARDR